MQRLSLKLINPLAFQGTNSDNGTATTSSTECSNFESEENGHNNLNGLGGHVVARERRHSTDDNLGGGGSAIYSSKDYVSNFHFDPQMSLSPSSFSENRRRRQESLV